MEEWIILLGFIAVLTVVGAIVGLVESVVFVEGSEDE